MSERAVSGCAAGVSAWEFGAWPSHRSLRLLAGPLASATSAARINRGCVCFRLHCGCKDTTKKPICQEFWGKIFQKNAFFFSALMKCRSNEHISWVLDEIRSRENCLLDKGP